MLDEDVSASGESIPDDGKVARPRSTLKEPDQEPQPVDLLVIRDCGQAACQSPPDELRIVSWAWSKESSDVRTSQVGSHLEGPK